MLLSSDSYTHSPTHMSELISKVKNREKVEIRILKCNSLENNAFVDFQTSSLGKRVFVYIRVDFLVFIFYLEIYKSNNRFSFFFQLGEVSSKDLHGLVMAAEFAVVKGESWAGS